MEYPGPWLPEPLAEPNQESAELASSLTTAFLVLLEQLAPTERAVFLLRDVFELDFDEIARSVGKSEANTRQILARARGRLRDARPRFTASRRESEEIVRRFRDASVTGNLDGLMAVLHADATLVSDGGGKAAAATRPVLGADRIAKFVLGYARKVHYSASDFELVTVNGAPGLLMRHPIAGTGTYSFDIVDGRIRAIYIVRNPDKLRGFLERTH
jgi:RNA polymerase sigma-70 factor (ECF subfamily)